MNKNTSKEVYNILKKLEKNVYHKIINLKLRF